jgi:LacI family transcriptional regulator
MENKIYTIKDIARMAEVSAGTVDRVLHNRGEVSKASLAKVQKVLEEIDYQPNMFAIGLAAKKKYNFVCLIPYYEEEDYWHSVSRGIERAAQEYRPFNVSIDYVRYQHANENSYQEACRTLQETMADAVLIAPNFREQTLTLVRHLKENKIPYAFIDFNIEGANALKYIGQDSYMSGYIAAKILMRDYKEGQELVFFQANNKDNPAEIQMQRRIEGFMKYMSDAYAGVKIVEFVLNKAETSDDRETLDAFFAAHPKAKLGVVFNSRVYQVGNYLLQSSKHMDALIGYDLLRKNVELLQSGEVKYLIGQRPALQGYRGIQALCEHVVFKKPVTAVKYMPIDILMKENINFYFEFE